MKSFCQWLIESTNDKKIGPVYKDSEINVGDYVEIVREGENFGRIMARIVDISKGSTIYNKTNSIKIQPTDFSVQHSRSNGLPIKQDAYWVEVPYKTDPETGMENHSHIWLLNSRWINV